jgi:hypothetical protein
MLAPTTAYWTHTHTRTRARAQVVSCICWVPGRRGVVAVSVTDPASQSQRLAALGRLAPAHILVWNFRDPIHPE